MNDVTARDSMPKPFARLTAFKNVQYRHDPLYPPATLVDPLREIPTFVLAQCSPDDPHAHIFKIEYGDYRKTHELSFPEVSEARAVLQALSHCFKIGSMYFGDIDLDVKADGIGIEINKSF